MDSERTKRETMANSSNKESRPGQRQWKRTAFGANFQYKKHNQSFVLMSYNILSQDNLEKQPFLYREHIEYALAWNYRLRYLQREIESIRPTILCLQEVQVTHLPGIANALQRLNYDRPLFKQRNGGQSDGCAIFYNRSLFQLVDHHCIEFFQPQISVSPRQVHLNVNASAADSYFSFFSFFRSWIDSMWQLWRSSRSAHSRNMHRQSSFVSAPHIYCTIRGVRMYAEPKHKFYSPNWIDSRATVWPRNRCQLYWPAISTVHRIRIFIGWLRTVKWRKVTIHDNCQPYWASPTFVSIMQSWRKMNVKRLR